MVIARFIHIIDKCVGIDYCLEVSKHFYV